MADYLPRSEVELNDWARAFAGNIAADPAAHGLSADDAAKISAAAESYRECYMRTLIPESRTAVAVHEKKKAARALTAVLRTYAALVRANPAVHDNRKLELQLRPKRRSKTVIPAPDTFPIIFVTVSEPGRHILRYQDPSVAEGSRKPAHAIGLQLFCHVGEKPPADPLDARFVRFVTRQNHVVDFKPQQIGQTAHYFARWQNATGETGPWSKVHSRMIAG